MSGRLSLMVCCHRSGRIAVNKYISHSTSGTSNTKQAALIAILVLTSEESITWPHSLSGPGNVRAWLGYAAHPVSRSENKSLRTANPDALTRRNCVPDCPRNLVGFLNDSP